MDFFDAVSPLDYRYYTREKAIFDALQPYLSERARIQYLGKVESALVKVLARKGICSMEIAKEIEMACQNIDPEAVYAEEDRIKHDIRALANVIRSKVSEKAKPFVHFSATSYDIVDTAKAIQYKDAAEKALIPMLVELEKTLMDLALREKDTVQMGRTHGQHAEPITFGLFVAGYVSRLGNRIQVLRQSATHLRGKFSGAVGAYNATSLLVDNPLELEALIMNELGIEASLSSTQIVEPEPLVDFMHAIISTFGVLADLSDDMRHLQRSEIGEVGEAFEKEQVGSSTMPHKRNPINFENVKSFWKAFVPRMITVYMDQLSEHQRDLTNSASQRFLPETMVALFACTHRLNRTLKKVRVDTVNVARNFDQSKHHVMAEPLYIVLASQGHPDAHEAVRKLTQRAQLENKTVMELVHVDAELKPYLEKFTESQRTILENPEKYVGVAPQKTERIVEHWRKELSLD